MNFNNYTIKSQEAIQRAQQLAQGLGQQDIQVEHIFKGIQEVDNNVLPFILKNRVSDSFYHFQFSINPVNLEIILNINFIPFIYLILFPV